MKKCFSLIVLLTTLNLASAQTVLPISSTEVHTISNCSEIVVSGDNYADASFHAIVLHKDPSIDGPITAVVNPSYFESIWGVDELAEIRIYGSADLNEPLLGVFNSSSNLEGFMLEIENETFRIEFESTEGSAGDGFEILLLCESALAELPKIKYAPTYQAGWSFDDELQTDVLTTCPETTNTFALTPTFLDPNAANQSVDTVLFKWAMGDNTFYRGHGLIEIEHTYSLGQGYQVTAYTLDTAGVESYTKFVVKNMPTPDFTVLDTEQVFCENQDAMVEGGMIGAEVVGATPSGTGISITEFYGEELYLPDGNDINYTTEINVSGFPDGTVLDLDAGLSSLCVNMEHSFLGDLEMMLTCPDGTSINVFNSFTGDGLFVGGFGGGGTYLGDANDDMFFDGIPGIGFDYCFADDAEFGMLADELAIGNTVPVSTFQAGVSMAPGSYLPEEPLSTFEGCPANGLWTLTVRDNLSVDDGWIFDWSLGFDMELGPGIIENELVDATWQSHPWITTVDESSITVTPSSGEPETLVFEVTDNIGCVFEKEIEIDATEDPDDFSELGICNLTYEFPWDADNGNIVLTEGSIDNIDITEVADVFIATASESGSYTFEYNDNLCGFTATAEIEFLPVDHPDCVTGINDIIISKSLKLVPNPSHTNTSIHLVLDSDEMLEISIVSLDGKLILKENIQYKSDTRVSLKTESLDSGTYIISAVGQSFHAASLFVKQ